MGFQKMKKLSHIHIFIITLLSLIMLYEGMYIYNLPPLPRELYIYKTFKGEPIINADTLINKHFQIGQTKQEVFKYLEDQDFKIYENKDKQPRYKERYKNSYAAVFPLRASIGRFFFTSYKGIVHVQFDENDKLMRSYGYIKINQL